MAYFCGEGDAFCSAFAFACAGDVIDLSKLITSGVLKIEGLEGSGKGLLVHCVLLASGERNWERNENAIYSAAIK